jgi:hypothetical protein
MHGHREQFGARPNAILSHVNLALMTQSQSPVTIWEYPRHRERHVDVIKTRFWAGIEDTSWQILQAIALEALGNAMTPVPEIPRHSLAKILATLLLTDPCGASTLGFDEFLEAFTANI